MTYAFVTEWMDPDAHAKFDADLGKSPVEQAREQAASGARELMAVFGMAQGMGG